MRFIGGEYMTGLKENRVGKSLLSRLRKSKTKSSVLKLSRIIFLEKNR